MRKPRLGPRVRLILVREYKVIRFESIFVYGYLDRLESRKNYSFDYDDNRQENCFNNAPRSKKIALSVLIDIKGAFDNTSLSPMERTLESFFFFQINL